MEERKEYLQDKILFRALGKEDNCFYEIKANQFSPSKMIIFSDDNKVKFIYPETLTAFTGKVDKNGKKIFMGDILRYYVPQDQQDEAGYVYEDFLVQWYEKQAGFCISTIKNSYEEGLSGSEDFEVVGNVFQNPELAEQFKNVRKTV